MDYVMLALFTASFVPLFIPWYVEKVILNPIIAVLSISIARFIAASGAFSLYAYLSILYARLMAPKIKRRKEEAVKVRRFLVLGGFIYHLLLLSYYLITLIAGSRTIDVLNIVGGISITLIMTFLVPLFRGEEVLARESDIRRLIKKANFVALGVKKAFYEKLVRNYGESIAIEFLSLKMRIDRAREKIIYWSFIAMVIASAPLLPLFVLGIWTIMLISSGYGKRERLFKTLYTTITIILTLYIITLTLHAPATLEFFAYTLPYILGLAIPLYIYIRRVMR